jgi:hypothetical protein
VKKIIILFVAFVFMIISGCQKKTNAETESMQTNDILTQLIKENVLSKSMASNKIEEVSNVSITEPTQETGVQKSVQTPLPLEPEVGVIKSNKQNVKEDRNIRDIDMESAVKNNPKQELAAQKKLYKKASYIRVGDDSIVQVASRNKSVKLTFAIFASVKGARFVDFYVYAAKKGKKPSIERQYLIARGKNIEVINGQSQLTRYWTGKNMDGNYLSRGKYNVYLVYKVRDKKFDSLRKDSRYWGTSDKYYVSLQ